MALDYHKAVRNIIILGTLVVLPLCLLLIQCCSPAIDGVKNPTIILSSTLWRLHNVTEPNGTQLLSIYGHLSRRFWKDKDKTKTRQFVQGITINISVSSHTDPEEADYADLDYKILHQMDIDESETRAYYKRKAVLESRKPSTTARPSKPIGDPVDCSLLFQADENEIERAKRKLRLEKAAFPSDGEIARKARDCPSYVKNEGYVTRVLSDAEAEFPLAFGIRLHDRAAQLERLLRTIYRPNNVYCLHVDAKSTASLHEAIRAIAGCLPNVFVASRPERYVYASFSPVAADLRCMRDVLDAGVDWKYFLNLAGTEFPLKTNREIVEILRTLNGTNDIEQYPYPTHYYHRFYWRHMTIGDTLVNTSEEKEAFRPTVSLQKGCSYNSFSRPFVEWLLRDEFAQRFINWTRDTDSPDELVWATLNHVPQAPGGYRVMVTQVAKTFLSREVIWDSSAAYCHGGKMVRGICILSVGDLQWLSNRWEMFANKFDIGYDHFALDCMEETLRNRTWNPDPDRDINWYGIYHAPHVTAKPTPARKENIRRHGYI